MAALARIGSAPSAPTDAMIAALNRVMATIEFSPSGEIIRCNANFEAAMGYSAAEVIGRHHRTFVLPDDAAAPEYAAFWRKLAAGEFVAGEFRRIAKGGREVWLQASYNPVVDRAGRVTSVVKFATDITAEKQKALEAAGQIDALNRAQAVIAFDPQGRILEANANFLSAMGYAREEIVGRHHSLFVEPAFAESTEYAAFWSRLRAGEHQSAEFRRIAKGGREVFIQAIYNPIKDARGQVIKVVKFATDVTDMVRRRRENEKLAADIQSDIGHVTGALNGISGQAGEVSSASREASRTIQGVAAATEELNASIGEISARVADSRTSADTAIELGRRTDEAANSLKQKARQMTGIVQLIDDIASQINMLALNATIESARAGEAGRGFAVVASEVKSLAAQVSGATKTITAEIAGVQQTSETVADALKEIEKAVSAIASGVGGVSVAVHQQTAVTAEISQTMQSAAHAMAEIDQNISTMAETLTSCSGAMDRARGKVEANIAAMLR
jgi:methyl-accepting chemotaxis protein